MAAVNICESHIQHTSIPIERSLYHSCQNTECQHYIVTLVLYRRYMLLEFNQWSDLWFALQNNGGKIIICHYFVCSYFLQPVSKPICLFSKPIFENLNIWFLINFEFYLGTLKSLIAADGHYLLKRFDLQL